EREQKEREEQVAHAGATNYATQPLGVNLELTQHQRQGVVTQPVGEDSLPGVDRTMTAWQHSQQPFQGSAPGLAGVQPKKSSLPLILAAVAVLVLGLGGTGIYFMTRTAEPTPTAKTDTTTKPKENPPPAIKAELIAIPGGTFQMGRDDGLPAGGPAHPVTVNGFSIDRTEVTNAEYAEFIRETKHTSPSHWAGEKPPAGQELWPVTNVSVADAESFAAWRSKRDGVTYRLPTEEEWEYAARSGDQNTLYPWGSTWIQGRANFKDAGLGSPRPVGSFPDGKNRWGVLDLMGNVWEWTSSKASLYPGNPETLPADQKDWTIIRGGSFLSESSGQRAVTATYRDWLKPTTTNPALGFRLVRPGS
ncbi:MAG TPA: SUMF1/EgtB/PvdO family nonheme iron enzyme, partial [Pyrinomonadaceae bacterium]|nr:SUMF1/EgtB/PvdO family nonheme iron enzyme [Pyrinomonadaceae bacterium]